MKNLPIEILLKIFILLPQEDQWECMLICHRWENIIEQFCLFRTLHVYSFSFLEKVWKKIEEQPRLGNTVHQLTLHLYDRTEVNLLDFLEKLPNLRKIRTYGPNNSNLVSRNLSTFSWCNHIESIEEENSGDEFTKSIVPHLLSNCVCPNLTVLRISNRNSNFIPLLKNAPALTSLFLERMNIRFVDINIMHESLPNLKTLKFKNATIYGGGIERNVTPVRSVTELSLSYIQVSSMEMELGLLQFITVKYPKLVELVHETNYFPRNNEEKNILYKNGWDPLLKALRPHLKKLYTDYTSQFHHFLPILDRNNCQIQHLNIYFPPIELFHDLVQSQQILHLQTLVLSNVRFNSLKWLKELRLLEVLEILLGRFEEPLRLDFNDIVNNCPSTVKSLKFRKVSLTGSVIGTRQCNVKDLSFVKSNITDKLIRFIDRHFPLLSNLKLKNCTNLPKTIILRSAELESFYLIDTDRAKPYHHRTKPMNLLIRTVYDGEERSYLTRDERCYSPIWSYKEFNEVDSPPVKSQPADHTNVKPDLTLCCFRVKKVILCRYVEKIYSYK